MSSPNRFKLVMSENRSCGKHSILFHTWHFLMPLRKKKKTFGSIVGKGENAYKQHFLLFQPCFLTYEKQIL